ncbi:MAG: hypothetical protein QXJ75_02280 [Candidatus Bathyarchaeia archaeon]
MPKRIAPSKCPSCGSSRIFRQQVEMLGSGTKGHRFDAYICEVCKYAQLYYKGSSSPVSREVEGTIGVEIKKDSATLPSSCTDEHHKASLLSKRD